MSDSTFRAIAGAFSLVALACARPAPQHPAAARSSGASAPAAEPAAPAVSGYDKPPTEILDVLHAPSPAQAYVDPTGNVMMLISWIDYPSITQVAEPFLKLAGVRLEPRTRSRHDTPGGYGIRPCARSLVLRSLAANKQTDVQLPTDRCVERPVWSADGQRFAFRATSAASVELWIGDVSGTVHAVPAVRLNPMLGYSVQWLTDQRSLLVKLVPEGQGAPPQAPALAIGPSIQETGGEKGESSTYETRDTLGSKHDEALFDYYASAQLAVVDAPTGSVRLVGAPGLYTSVEVAPAGKYWLVESLKRPYSYVTTYDRFAHDVSIWNVGDQTQKIIASLPVADRVPVHGVPTGPRDFDWRANEPATLVWAEALDGGDWHADVPARDKLMMQRAPFVAAPTEVMRVTQRFNGIHWSEQKNIALLHETDDNRHWTKTFVVNVDDPTQKPRTLWDRSIEERYLNPGAVVWKQLPNGQWVMRQHGDAIYLAGQGASPEGDRPFLDKLDLKTFQSTRLFRSDKLAFETFVAFASHDNTSFVTWHQSVSSPPNAYLRRLGGSVTALSGESQIASTSSALTSYADPAPVVRQIEKRLVKYKRADGVDLSFTLYTPPGYREGTRVPAILYAYPLDYADASKAGQVSGSEQMFTRLRSYKLLLLAGYAIIDDTSFPIVGDPKKAYDTYLEQLVSDAKAAVAKAVELGVVDPARVGVTGHSHGALMTVNLLAHSDLFRAGVATSGSYNKTLTPFGFQNERRSVWEARDVYLKASPFFSADTLKRPVLIMHGADDANPGTTPLQAVKLYEAIRGNGGTARLVMLPHEPHWYAAMESQEQLVAEMVRWFDKYVKNAPSR